jgi:hypothetical protein
MVNPDLEDPHIIFISGIEMARYMNSEDIGANWGITPRHKYNNNQTGY